MSTIVAPPATPAPLTNLSHEEREKVIAAITTHLAPSDAVAVLAALAGSREELSAVPFDVQERAQAAILQTLPAGTNAIVVSTLGIGLKSDEEYLEEILTEQEKADPEFRRGVEEEAKRRGIQRWLAAVKLRYAHMSLDEFREEVEHRQGEQTQEHTAV